MVSRPRLVAAVEGALEVERFWIEQIQYEEPEAGPDPAGDLTWKVSRPQLLHDPEEPGRAQVRIRVQASGAGRVLDMVGVATVSAAAAPDEEQAAFIHINAPLVVLGSMRGVIAALTGATGLGRIDMPTLNLTALLD
ncbi:MAG: hypothetical protein HYX53_17130 [Chloroflexi bacterium]|nr:hypothetical protein [Chloroflexota bacterium]